MNSTVLYYRQKNGKGINMKKQYNKNKIFRPVNVLTAFLVLAIIGVIVGYLLMFLNDNYGFDDREPLKVEEYTVEISIKNTEAVNLNQFLIGTEFNLTGKNTYFGSICSHAVYEQDTHNLNVLLKTVGTYTENEGFKLNGNIPLSSGETINVHNGALEYTVEIKSIYKK